MWTSGVGSASGGDHGRRGPVPASPGGGLGGTCVLGGYVGDGVEGLAGSLLRSLETAAALDAREWGGVREDQAVDGDDLHETSFVAAVAPVVVAVSHGDLLLSRAWS